MAELAGFDVPQAVSGVSQAGLMQDVNVRVRESALSEMRGSWTIRTEDDHYTRFNHGGPGKIELYDVRADEAEMNNLAHSDPERYASVIRKMEDLLQARIKKAQ